MCVCLRNGKRKRRRTPQQLDLVRAHSQTHGWQWQDEHIFRDDGESSASLRRPGLDRLRDQVRCAAFDRVVITAPDRLARNYVHQMLLIEELEQGGCQVEFVERPMSHDPHDQLLLQIRGAVAEYERSLIAERMRRGRRQKYSGRADCFPGPVRPMAIGLIRPIHAIRQESAWSQQKQLWWQSCSPAISKKAGA